LLTLPLPRNLEESKKVKAMKVLFVCMGNSCRSPMAEAIARRDAADVIEARSAGLMPLGFVADLTKETLEQGGYSAEGLESKAILRGIGKRRTW
jgi:protein-tyrosine-phosphatase